MRKFVGFLCALFIMMMSQKPRKNRSKRVFIKGIIKSSINSCFFVKISQNLQRILHLYMTTKVRLDLGILPVNE